MCTLSRWRCAPGAVCWVFFNRASLGTVGRQEEQLKAGMRGQPPLHGLGLVDLIVIDDHIEAGELRERIRLVERRQQVQKQARGLAPPHPMDDRAPAQIPSPSEIALLIGPRGQDFELLPFGHPLIPDFG